MFRETTKLRLTLWVYFEYRTNNNGSSYKVSLGSATIIRYRPVANNQTSGWLALPTLSLEDRVNVDAVPVLRLESNWLNRARRLNPKKPPHH
ncbi:hypothetical protein K443DRAFT_462923 [Laccaria amethystina LaAM-08-1]|uniref:Uncharacterized protein n=1 Tax=Laccaria amethystina LaAM-08-1 TaxID=1095629 RepID=A0A0C9WUA7_9AGAR|nr:hypothetical protein K443DRAFT_462923 [Laccaria amethystina LaAM-08-1]